MVATFLKPPGSLASGRMVGDKEHDRPQNAIDRKPRSDDGYPVREELSWRRGCASLAIGVVGGNSIDAARETGWGVGIDPRSIRVGGVVIDDLPRPGGAVLTLDDVLNRARATAPGNDASCTDDGDDRSGRNGVRRHGEAGNFEGMVAQEIGAGRPCRLSS
jgi:hypothetical protein